MAKKSKSKSGSSSGLLSAKRMMGFFRFGLLLLLVASVIIWLKPDLVTDPVKRQQIDKLKTQSGSISQNIQSDILGLLTNGQTEAITSQLPETILVGGEEIVVEDLIKSLTKQLEQIPASSLERFRTDFCSPLVTQAIREATSSGVEE